VERVVDTDAADTATIEAPDPLTPASTTESLGDEFSPELPPAPGAVLPHPILCSAETHRTLSGFRAVYSYFPCATGGELFTRRDVRIPSSLLNSDEDMPTKKKQKCELSQAVS
jgi:hypothetical protein